MNRLPALLRHLPRSRRTILSLLGAAGACTDFTATYDFASVTVAATRAAPTDPHRCRWWPTSRFWQLHGGRPRPPNPRMRGGLQLHRLAGSEARMATTRTPHSPSARSLRPREYFSVKCDHAPAGRVCAEPSRASLLPSSVRAPASGPTPSGRMPGATASRRTPPRVGQPRERQPLGADGRRVFWTFDAQTNAQNGSTVHADRPQLPEYHDTGDLPFLMVGTRSGKRRLHLLDR